MKKTFMTSVLALSLLPLSLYAEEETDFLENSVVNQVTIDESVSFNIDEEKLRIIIREEISNNPQLIIDSLQAYEKEMQAKMLEQQGNLDIKNLEQFSTEIYGNPATPIFGDNPGSIVIVEFFDYNCKFCKQAAPVLDKVIETYNVRRIYKELPILSMDSLEVATIAQVVMNNYPDSYEEFHRKIYSLPAPVNKIDALSILEEININKEEIESLSSLENNMSTLMQNAQLAQNLGITGTPAFIVGNKILRGAPSFEDFSNLLDK